MRREVDPDVYCPQAALVDEETNRRTERRLARYRAKVESEKLQRERTMQLEQEQYRQWFWTAGWTFVAAVLGFIWCRLFFRTGRGQKRRQGGRGGGENLPRDLFLEEDDGFWTEEELFEQATEVARKFPAGMLDQRDQLMLYGLYKQATEGDRNVEPPSKLNVVAYAKYNAWGEFQGLPKQYAKKKYCEVVYHLNIKGDSASKYGGQGNDANDDVFYDDDNQGDVDEDGCPINESGDDGMPRGMGMRPSTLSGNMDAKSQSEIGSTPEIRLRNAASANDVAALETILEGVCDINGADEAGQTALHFAADRGTTDCVKLLVDAGANVNAVDCDGIGVLQTALSAGLDSGSVRILLEAGADPDACDEDGDSARKWVSEEANEDMVKLFATYPAR